MFREALNARAWSQAVRLYAGEFLSGISVGADNFELEEWLYGTREALAGLATTAFVEVAERAQRNGDLTEAGRLVSRAIACVEAANGVTTNLLLRVRSLALATHDPAIRVVEEEIASLGPVADDLPRSNGATAGRTVPFPQLPRRHTTFVGRTDELAALHAIVTSGRRLVTITGMGGAGKSSLALELGNELLAGGSFDAVLFVQCASVTPDDSVAIHVCNVVAPDRVMENPLQALASLLKETTTLLILDGFEHLSPISPQVSELLEACPNLTAVVTSRRPLSLLEETTFPLRGLPLPVEPNARLTNPDEFGGLRLFVERARRVTPTFTLDESNVREATEVCHAVGGLPLGIELAASLTHALALDDLLRLLQADLTLLQAPAANVEAGNVSLYAVLEQTWQQLDRVERDSLTACAVFHDGFTLDAGIAVAGLTPRVITTLVEKSVISRSGNRYNLHPLVRLHASEKLKELDGATTVNDRHAAYYAALLSSTEPYCMTAGERLALDEVATEYSNVRAAWNWAITCGSTDLLESMVRPYSRYLYVRRPPHESLAALKAALAVVGPASPQRARLSRAIGATLLVTSPTGALTYLEYATNQALSSGFISEAGAAMNLLAVAYTNTGQPERARELYKHAISLLKEADDERVLGGSYANLAALTTDAKEAESLLLEGVRVCRANGNVLILPVLLNNLGSRLSSKEGKERASLELLLEGLDLELAEARRPGLLARLHERAAQCLLQLGELEAAEEHLSNLRTVLSSETWISAGNADSFDLQLLETRTHYYVLRARGEVTSSLAVATKPKEQGYLRESLCWHALKVGDEPSLREHVLRFREENREALREGAVTTRERVLAHLLQAGLLTLAAKRGRDSTTTAIRSAHRTLDPAVVAELHNGLRLELSLGSLSLARVAVLVAYVCVPNLVTREQLRSIATHPTCYWETRRWATLLFKSHPEPWACPLEGFTETLPTASEPKSSGELLELIDSLARRLEGLRVEPNPAYPLLSTRR